VPRNREQYVMVKGKRVKITVIPVSEIATQENEEPEIKEEEEN